MVVRTALFLIPAALLLVPAAVVAQAPAPAVPPEVEQALRARVNEFFQDFVDGKYRQAINLVAENTQDEYFAASKAEIKEFKIDAVTFSSDFTKADVALTVKQVWKMKAEGFVRDTVVDSPWMTTWKIENEKWVYTHQIQPNGWVTPMGPSEGFRKPDGTTVIPNKLDDATLAQEAQRILHQSGIDKNEVTLSPDKLSSATVTFHNGAPGSVSVGVEGLPKGLPGLTVKFDKKDLNAGQDAVLEISYDPTAGEQTPPPTVTIALEVAPFGQYVPILVNFGTPAK
jgi:hypothetical protein